MPRIGSSREKLVRQTREALAERLHLTASELDTLMGFVRSRVNANLSTFGGQAP